MKPQRLFCILLILLYFILPGSVQWILLLVFSLYFYTRAGYPALVFLLITAAAAFGTALWMEKENEVKFRYRVRAVTAGEFALPGVAVDAMYAPAVRARRAPGRVVVRR